MGEHRSQSLARYVLPLTFLMHQAINYPQILRAIGQALEYLEVDTFRLICEGNNYLVQELSQGAEREIAPHASDTHASSSARFPDLLFTPADIARLENEGRARRRQPEGLPQPDSLANLLRAAGSYILDDNSCLIEMTKRDDHCLEIRCKEESGEARTERMEISDLYLIFVRMYLKRADRSRRVESQPEVA
ncbi:MAG: hypothetical protein HY695_37115 [Deltaproteobacteria bacterium]|nr:hypothetical protein [Deltaproteobacteria bacterium]